MKNDSQIIVKMSSDERRLLKKLAIERGFGGYSPYIRDLLSRDMKSPPELTAEQICAIRAGRVKR